MQSDHEFQDIGQKVMDDKLCRRRFHCVGQKDEKLLGSELRVSKELWRYEASAVEVEVKNDL